MVTVKLIVFVSELNYNCSAKIKYNAFTVTVLNEIANVHRSGILTQCIHIHTHTYKHKYVHTYNNTQSIMTLHKTIQLSKDRQKLDKTCNIAIVYCILHRYINEVEVG